MLKYRQLRARYKDALSTHLSPTTVTQTLHDRVDLRLEHLGQLGAVLVDTRRLAVVQPGVVEHEPDVLHVLPRLLVLARVQLPLDGGQVHGVLHDVKVVLLRKWAGQGRRSVVRGWRRGRGPRAEKRFRRSGW